MNGDSYHHTQKGPWGLMCYAFAAAFLVAAISVPVLALQITFFVTALFMLLLGASCGYLTVEDEGDRLLVCFGPFPMFWSASPTMTSSKSRQVERLSWKVGASTGAPGAGGSGTSGDTTVLPFG